ncbi:MAG: hypothetical protein ACRENI_11900 [Gemmatimonadaceae bacterium]
MKFVLHGYFGLVAIAGIMVATGCSEDLESGEGCPILCPDQNIPLRDTTISPIVIDTSFTGIPPFGSEGFALLASRGDTVQTHVILRFDDLPTRYRPVADDTTTQPITAIDTAYIALRADTTGAVLPDTVLFDVYEVSGPTTDTVAADLAARFVPERRIGGARIAGDRLSSAAFADSIHIPLSDSALLDAIEGDSALRIGIAASGALGESVQLRIGTAEGQRSAQLVFDAVPDTILLDSVAVSSATPEADPDLARNLADYTIVLDGTPPPGADELIVGGLPGRRTYLRFDLPSSVLDSTTIVRAQLLLTPVPGFGGPGFDDIVVRTALVTANASVTDPAKASLFFVTGIRVDSLVIDPDDSDVQVLDIVNLLRIWLSQDPEETPRAIVLFTESEGTLPGSFRFYSSEAAADLRPRLRLTYIPRVGFGLP